MSQGTDEGDNLADMIQPYALKGGRHAGKPRSLLPQDLVAKLGPPPRDTLERKRWYAYKLALIDYGISLGHPWQQMAHTTRQSALADLRLSGELLADDVKKMLDKQNKSAAVEAGDAAAANEMEVTKDVATRPRPLRIAT